MILSHDSCGHELRTTVVCAHCGDQVRLHEIHAHAGPSFPQRLLDNPEVAARFGISADT
ncbi:hypothetical protein ACFWVM_05685 [Nocardia fluminea]|uniref:hypothetical protein n=1 Tax=Nocardia fluminea TaxID=134984 RepID=UPI003650410C